MVANRTLLNQILPIQSQVDHIHLNSNNNNSSRVITITTNQVNNNHILSLPTHISQQPLRSTGPHTRPHPTLTRTPGHRTTRPIPCSHCTHTHRLRITHHHHHLLLPLRPIDHTQRLLSRLPSPRHHRPIRAINNSLQPHLYHIGPRQQAIIHSLRVIIHRHRLLLRIRRLRIVSRLSHHPHIRIIQFHHRQHPHPPLIDPLLLRRHMRMLFAPNTRARMYVIIAIKFAGVCKESLNLFESSNS